MMYFGNPCTAAVRIAMTGNLGMIATPAQGNPVPDRAVWCADNGCFGNSYPGDDRYLEFLAAHGPERDRCAFAVAPDVPLDMAASLARSLPMLARIRAAGFPVALAAQNGAETMTLPWDEFDALFPGRRYRLETRRARADTDSAGTGPGQAGAHGTRQLAAAPGARGRDRVHQRGRHLPHPRAGQEPAQAPGLAADRQRPAAVDPAGDGGARSCRPRGQRQAGRPRASGPGTTTAPGSIRQGGSGGAR